MVMRLILLVLVTGYSTLLFGRDLEQPEANFKITYFQNEREIAPTDISLWQKELLSVKVNMVTTEEFSYIKTDSWNNHSFIFDSQSVAQNNQLGDKLYEKSILLYVWPVNAGQQQLELPAINLILSGRTIQKLHIPPLTLQVKPLPEYLPPGFPVGKITLTDDYQTNAILPFFFLTNNLASYSLVIKSSGLYAASVPDYSKYLRNRDIRTLPALEKNTSKSTDTVYTNLQTINIPLIIKNSGIYSLGQFRVLSFDPETGKIISYYFKPRTFLSLNVPLHLLLFSLLLIITYLLLRYLIKIKARIQARRRVWHNIIHSSDSLQFSQAIRQLRSSYRLFSRPHDLTSHMSLSRWADGWQCQDLSDSIQTLNSVVFAASQASSYPAIKQQVIRRLKRLDCRIYYSGLG